MRKSKKLTAFLLTAALIMPTVKYTVTAADVETSKISAELLAQMQDAEKKEELPVIIWTKDIDRQEVMEEVEETTGIDVQNYFSTEELVVADAAKALSFAVNQDDSMVEEVNTYLKETKKERKEQLKETKQFNKTERKIAKEKYLEQNDAFVAENLDKEDVSFTSSYAPMIITNATVKEIQKLSNDAEVVSIEYYNAEEEEKAEDCLAVAKDTTRICTLRNIYDLTGQGVTIGMVESGCPYSNNEEIVDSNIIRLNNERTEHATLVSSILVGTNGIAPNATLYSASRYDVYSSIETLISNGVQVINMSNGYARGGNYTNVAKWMDHISAQHNVTFVASAGNGSWNGNKEGKILDSAMGYNVISVGAIDDNNTTDLTDDTIAHYSSMVSNAALKPEIYAPGSNITNAGYTNSGTSFSAPIVTGICALLIEEYPILGRIPTLLKATLLAGAHDLDGYTYDDVTDVTGDLRCGTVDAYKSYRALYRENYAYGTLAKGKTTFRSTITPSSTGTCRYCIVWEKNNEFADGASHTIDLEAHRDDLLDDEELDFTDIDLDDFTEGEVVDLSVKIKDSNGNVVAVSNLSNTTFELCTFECQGGEEYSVVITASQKLNAELTYSAVYI